MFPLKHNLEFVAKAKSLGCRVEYKVYDSVEHGFFYGVTRRQQKEAFSDVISFINSLYLRPVEVKPRVSLARIRENVASMGLTEKDIEDAISWARRK